MSGGGSQTSNTVSEFKPPDYTQGLWQDFTNQAAGLAQQPYQQYGGMTVAPWNGTQDAAAGLTAEQALHGSPDMTAARASNTGMSEGAYLGNPYLNPEYVNNVIGDNADTMAQAYATGSAADQARNAQMSGAFGGGGDKAMQLMGQQGLERQVGQMANQYQLGNAQAGASDYRAGTGQMLGANSQATGFNAADIANNQALMGVGNSQNQYMQALLNQGQTNFNNQQQYPQQMLGLLQQALQAASGSSGSTIGSQTQTGTPSWVTGGLGAGAGLYGLLQGMK
jgi:hypothetical protein